MCSPLSCAQLEKQVMELAMVNYTLNTAKNLRACMGRQQNPRDIKANGGINGTVERVNFYNLPISAIGGGHHRGK